MQSRDGHPDLTILTEKQAEALALAAQHFSSKEIARELGISPRTVEQRLDAARTKLGVATRAEAARLFQSAHPDMGYRTPCEPSPMDLDGASDPQTGVPDADLELRDPLPIRRRIPWEEESERHLLGVRPIDLGSTSRLLLVVGIALASLVLVLIGLSVARTLSELV